VERGVGEVKGGRWICVFLSKGSERRWLAVWGRGEGSLLAVWKWLRPGMVADWSISSTRYSALLLQSPPLLLPPVLPDAPNLPFLTSYAPTARRSPPPCCACCSRSSSSRRSTRRAAAAAVRRAAATNPTLKMNPRRELAGVLAS
jgi:hypothetical protein